MFGQHALFSPQLEIIKPNIALAQKSTYKFPITINELSIMYTDGPNFKFFHVCL